MPLPSGRESRSSAFYCSVIGLVVDSVVGSVVGSLICSVLVSPLAARKSRSSAEPHARELHFYDAV